MEFEINNDFNKELTFGDLEKGSLFKFKKPNCFVGKVLCMKTIHKEDDLDYGNSFVALGSGMSFIANVLKDSPVEQYKQNQPVSLREVK